MESNKKLHSIVKHTETPQQTYQINSITNHHIYNNPIYHKNMYGNNNNIHYIPQMPCYYNIQRNMQFNPPKIIDNRMYNMDRNKQSNTLM
jgi:hypothetical protein